MVAEPLRHKRDIADVLGADDVIDPLAHNLREAVLDRTAVGADVVIECVGKPDTAGLALDLARKGGTVEFFGVCPVGETVPLEPNKVYARELTIVGSYVNPHAFARSIALLESGRVRVDRFQIDRFPLAGVHEALTLQREGRTIKSILQPNA
jgi:threonine dehydrogenase-like Zn-dependent dehydrogenase